MSDRRTEVLVIGSGAGGAVTAARLAEAGRSVLIVEEGPWVEPGSLEPFSLEEMATQYRHRGLAASLGNPAIAYAEGRCVGGSTEINSGLYARLPDELADDWRRTYAIEEFTPELLGRFSDELEKEVVVNRVPGDPLPSSIVLEHGADALGWRSAEFARVFDYDAQGRGTKQSMSRTMIPRALAAGAEVVADTRVHKLLRRGDRTTGALVEQTRPDGTRAKLTIHAEHVFVCAGAVHTPALLQRSGFRHRIGVGLKMHPTVKVAARFPQVLDHHDVPMHRVMQFSPNLSIGGSASRKGHLALALAECGADFSEALAAWEHAAVYYAAIRSEGSGRVIALPGMKAPLVTYNLTDGDVSRLNRGLVHVGEVLLAAGATEMFPSIVGGPVVRRREDLHQWWTAMTRANANLMTVHLTSTVRMGQDRDRTGSDSFGRVWGTSNLRVNDGSLLPDAPGVNPQSAIMAIAARNADQFLSDPLGPA